MKNELVEIIESYNNYISKIPRGCDQIVSLFNEDRINEALLGIVDFSEGISWLIEVEKILEKNNITINWKEKEFLGFLKEVNSGLEMQDYVLVSDLFEYEINPFFENIEVIEQA